MSCDLQNACASPPARYFDHALRLLPVVPLAQASAWHTLPSTLKYKPCGSCGTQSPSLVLDCPWNSFLSFSTAELSPVSVL